MISLTPITDSAEDVFLGCINNMQNAALKAALIAVSKEIVKHDTDFDSAGKRLEFYKLKAHNRVGATITTENMKWVYEQRMVDSVDGRVFYEKIKALPEHGICPLCAHGDVSTLDHYLPKSEFPGLAVNPKNLAPSCTDCNSVKSSSVPTCESKQTLNPYYDKIGAGIWLTAKVKMQIPVVVTFSVTKPSALDNMIVRRIRQHFNAFDLARRYSLQAARELQGIKKALTDLLNSGGHSDVRSHLSRQADSRGVPNVNSWQAALYRALEASDWFCKVGCKG